jgi:hypothetical protein
MKSGSTPQATEDKVCVYDMILDPFLWTPKKSEEGRTRFLDRIYPYFEFTTPCIPHPFR